MNATINPVFSVEDIDYAAENICNVLKEAIAAVGERSKRGNGKSAQWWNLDFKAAQLIYRSTVTELERLMQARVYRKTVVSAKREFWKRQVEGMVSPKQIFKLMRWATPKYNNLPPLIYEGQIISNQNERACVLRDSVLARHQANDDLLPDKIYKIIITYNYAEWIFTGRGLSD